MKPIHIVFVIAFGLAGAVSLFEFNKQPPIKRIPQIFQKFTNVRQLPKGFKLYHINEDIIPKLRWRLLLGFLGGLVYGFFMMRYVIWAIRKRSEVSSETTE